MSRKTKLTIADLTDIVERDAIRTADLSKVIAWLAHYDQIVHEARQWHRVTKGDFYSPTDQRAAKRKVTKYEAEQREMIAAFRRINAALKLAAFPVSVK